jgi:hypothetical protein
MPNADDYPWFYSEDFDGYSYCNSTASDDEYSYESEFYKTVSEWNAVNRIIKKGEKGIWLECRRRRVFVESQTVPFNLFYISKKNGQFRRIFSLYEKEKAELREFIPHLEEILLKLDTNNVNYGFIRNRNSILNAMQHIGYKYTVSMDLKNFFESVTPDHVKRYVSQEIIERCFISGAPQQGLPTSPTLANLAFLECDQKIIASMSTFNIDGKYTRYADDLIFSVDDKKSIGKIIFLTTQAVESCGFKINRKKTKIQNIKNGRIIITGVGIDNKGIHPTRKTKRKIRAAIHQKNKYSLSGLEEWARCKLPKPKRVEDNICHERAEIINFLNKRNREG